MESKPDKILYENQELVWNEAEKFLLELIKNEPCVNKAVVWASLAEGKFGVYETIYRKREGSDIDLVIVVNENKPLPKQWKNTGIEKSWFDLYHNLGKFIHEGHVHEIDGLIVFPSKHDMKKVEEALKGRSRVIFVRE